MYGSASVGWLIIQATDVGGRPSRVAADLEVTVSGPPGLAPQTVTIPRATSSTVVALGALPPDAQPTLRVSAPGVEAAELTVRPSRGSLPAVSGPAGGGTPAPAFEFGRWRIPVLWVFIPAAVAVLGLLAVVAWSMRSARPESP
jgi:hypothetical protein